MTVVQGSQTRTFTYSSISRLRTAANPESGTITYAYDNNGNLTSKIDARSITTSYVYDALNRVTDRDYSDSTPDVDYFYGTAAPKIGKLTKVTSSVSTTEYTSFDILGRVTGHKQTTDGQQYTTGYSYNLAGALTEETYPSGRVVKNVLKNSGDLSIVQSKKNASSGYWHYADAFTYNAAGAVTSMQLGNGRWESTAFNSRFQATQITLGTTNTGTLAYDMLKLNYGYDTTANNGNMLTQDITIKRSGQSDLVFNQTYTHDELNRLKIAEEKTGTTTNWKQTYAVDRHGNRTFDTQNTSYPTAFNFATNPSINAINNRFNSGQNWSYDSAGNVTADAEGRTFVFDAENKQVEVKDSANVTLGVYMFDGNGNRVKKIVPSTGETTVFVYNATRKLVAEYSTNVVPVQDAAVQYLTSDHLGSPRIKTNRDGEIVSRTDYMPYGEEIISLGGRSVADDYVADDVRHGYTGYVADEETGLDFALARMYAATVGRFSSTDPILFSERRALDPQRINLYAYTRNSPLVLTDKSGEVIDDQGLADNKN